MKEKNESIIQSILKEHWGYASFRPLQEDIILSVLEGNDTLALLPTGGGKSICYQVPALARPGLCLVISPLIALMKDQVEQLRKRGITAYAIYSGLSRKEVINILTTAASSNCKFLYVSPERLETALFLEYLPALQVSLLAVDEAHCVSQWGYDFRPPYLRIANLRKELHNVPVLALTASATPAVQEDIMNKLEFTAKKIFRQSFERPNLSYSVFESDAKINKIIEILNKVPGSSLVYCRSRKKTKEISELLKMRGISADFYHAGLPQSVRSEKQEAWISNRIRTMACTNAFGMGIDKPDVRVVIHADAPDCLENYYQEAGRAGRDGKRAYAVLLYSDQEPAELRKMPEERFPPIAEMRKVYQSVMNYLQLPAGSGEGNYYDFDLPDFLQKFKHEASLVWATIKTLEQEDILGYNEQVFLPSTIQVISNRDIIFEFEKSNPSLEPVIKILLRTYEGIFDYPVKIFEKSIAYLLKSDADTVKKQLAQLHAYRIIAYTPQKENAQLFFPVNRVPAEYLKVDQQRIDRRKQEFTQRIDSFLKFLEEKNECRSSFIGRYFGDANVQSCGICDNCLHTARKKMDATEFDNISSTILSSLHKKELTAEQILIQLKGTHREKIWQVIDFLQTEGKIEADHAGRLSLKN